MTPDDWVVAMPTCALVKQRSVAGLTSEMLAGDGLLRARRSAAQPCSSRPASSSQVLRYSYYALAGRPAETSMQAPQQCTACALCTAGWLLCTSYYTVLVHEHMYGHWLWLAAD
eukprot:COSAG01_NODE_1747_length_9331_cov_5.997509_2_plen_114_part_00